MKMIQLCVHDFDGNGFRTFDASPGNVNVHTACRQAVGDIFGSVILKFYDESGGLKNRAPVELMSDLLVKNPLLIDVAHNYYQSNRVALDSFMPEGKGFLLGWHTNPVMALAELFTRRKLQILTAEISAEQCGDDTWPQLTKNFDVFWREIKATPDSYTAILSSGHDYFIKRVFDLWDLELPDVMVTDDDMRAIEQGNGIAPYKPDPQLMYEVWDRFESRTGLRSDQYQTIYFGDDAEKDGGLAESAGVPFYHFGDSDPKGFDTTKDWLDRVPLVGRNVA